jgi:hypothetical protein
MIVALAAVVVLALQVPVPVSTSRATLCARSRNSSIENWHEQRDDRAVRWRAHWSGDDCTIDLRATGDVKFNRDFTDIVSITDNGTLDITAITGDETRRVAMRASGNELTRSWTVNGRAQPWDDSARRWLADFLIDLDRMSGIGVEYRLPGLLAQGGPRAVLDETERMTSDYPRSVYIRRMIETTKLSDADYQRTVSLASRTFSSDYEMSRILRLVAERSPLDNAAMRKSYLDAVAKMTSDYERSRVLQTIFAKSAITDDVAREAVRAASTFTSDYERSRVLLAAIESKALDAGDVVPILEVAAKSTSDYEKSRVLLAVVKRWALDADGRRAYLKAAEGIKSDYENRRVLAALVQQEARRE